MYINRYRKKSLSPSDKYHYHGVGIIIVIRNHYHRQINRYQTKKKYRNPKPLSEITINHYQWARIVIVSGNHYQ